MASKLCPGCSTNHIDPRAKQCLECRRRGGYQNVGSATQTSASTSTPAAQVARDRELERARQDARSYRERYTEALQTIERYEGELRVASQLKDGLETYTIEPSTPRDRGEATVVVVASDWHIEERVGAEMGGLNTFNEEIATERISRFFRKAHSLTELCAARVEIPTMVLALLGDFVSNAELHGGEHAESMEEAPMHAIVRAQNHLVSGIEYLLAQAPNRKLVIPCHSGNHARTTQRTRFNAENGHSLEFLMYQHLAAYFRTDPRVQFVIPEGPHSYMDIYGQTVRFQHGHMVKYNGGVGGLTIPLLKATAQWNKARSADLDVLGHFHQYLDLGSAVVNGSLIGYNSFALSIKASYERPTQALFLMDKKRGRTGRWPIYL